MRKTTWRTLRRRRTSCWTASSHSTPTRTGWYRARRSRTYWRGTRRPPRCAGTRTTATKCTTWCFAALRRWTSMTRETSGACDAVTALIETRPLTACSFPEFLLAIQQWAADAGEPDLDSASPSSAAPSKSSSQSASKSSSAASVTKLSSASLDRHIHPSPRPSKAASPGTSVGAI